MSKMFVIILIINVGWAVLLCFVFRHMASNCLVMFFHWKMQIFPMENESFATGKRPVFQYITLPFLVQILNLTFIKNVV